MLNQTILLRFIESRLGYKYRDLELDDNEIMQLITQETIPTFSRYFPHIHRIVVTQKDIVEGYRNIYYIDKEEAYERYDIINVKQVFLGQQSGGGYDKASVLGYGYGQGFGGAMAGAFKAPYNPVVFEFMPPNKLEIRPSALLAHFTVELNVVHPNHLSTIQPGLEMEFMQLALYDVQIALYRIRQRFNNLSTPFGSIELFIQDLEEASGKRDEMIDKFKQKFAFSSSRKKLFTY